MYSIFTDNVDYARADASRVWRHGVGVRELHCGGATRSLFLRLFKASSQSESGFVAIVEKLTNQAQLIHLSADWSFRSNNQTHRDRTLDMPE